MGTSDNQARGQEGEPNDIDRALERYYGPVVYYIHWATDVSGRLVGWASNIFRTEHKEYDIVLVEVTVVQLLQYGGTGSLVDAHRAAREQRLDSKGPNGLDSGVCLSRQNPSSRREFVNIVLHNTGLLLIMIRCPTFKLQSFKLQRSIQTYMILRLHFAAMSPGSDRNTLIITNDSGTNWVAIDFHEFTLAAFLALLVLICTGTGRIPGYVASIA